MSSALHLRARPDACTPTQPTLFGLARKIDMLVAALTAPPRFAYTMRETCQACAISEPTLRSWLASGRIVGTRTGGKTGVWLFTPEAIQAALAKGDGPSSLSTMADSPMVDNSEKALPG